MMVLACALAGCASGPGDEGMSGSGQLCVDRAKRENALYLQAVSAVLASDKRVSVDEWNGCDSANNGAALSVLVSPELRRDALWKAFVEAGWSPASAACAPGCTDFQLVDQVDQRLIGIAIKEATDTAPEGRHQGLWVEVAAADSCWDDHGYRCS
ncbi:hypothetical protein [Nonomuraea rhodomycinica]|uniref:Uncharacterized protein n=1 Tax=Nonomuraea rhodomycinica TaxID=1712872 RepID=A0A7Y6IL16_9ACTN|nr:hypothetical protein [Nonomuraea rhodomycinica]NUW40199.1 hypothetical protein [Nonomuraea rhodomycinica]